MANNSRRSFEKQLNQAENKLASDILSDYDETRYPERIDWVGSYIATRGQYTVGMNSANSVVLGKDNFDSAIRQPYLSGLKELTGNTGFVNALPRDYPLGKTVIDFAGLVSGLEKISDPEPDDVVDPDLEPGEVLGRLIIRELKRSATGEKAHLAQSLHSETTSPRELIEQLCAYPELAELAQDLFPDDSETDQLVRRLGAVQLSTELWPHQREALVEWLKSGANGYANMATATGKTVLGLAAVGYTLKGTADSAYSNGALHPTDEQKVANKFQGQPPTPGAGRETNILIVTTDTLLGAQWSRLFEEHCETPPEYTRIINDVIRLPWGDIDIRSADSLDDVDPSTYRLAIFDEVHNYKRGKGWGNHLTEFIESDCPVLALTGSINDDLKGIFQRKDKHFPEIAEYTHEKALNDGIIPDFEWSLDFVPVDSEESSTLEKLEETAELSKNFTTEVGNKLQLTDKGRSIIRDKTGECPTELENEFESPGKLANALRRAGKKDTAPTEDLDQFASGLSNRQPHWWNLRADISIIEDLVAEAMENDSPTLILTRSYAEGKSVWQHLQQSDHVQREVMKTLSKGDSKTHDEEIQSFDNESTGKKILIGPGDRIGTGVDIKTVEVGINLARPGTGLSTTLIQRLGRLLRKSNGKDSVEFHHILGVPPKDSIIATDGTTFINNVSGFFAQVKEPQTNSIMKLPTVTADAQVVDSLQKLEQYGAFMSADKSDGFKQALVSAITNSQDSSDQLIIQSEWYAELLSDKSQKDIEISDKNNSQRNLDMDTFTQNNAVDSSKDNSQNSVEMRQETALKVDSALVALINQQISNGDLSYDNREEYLIDTLETYLKPLIGNRSSNSITKRTSKREIKVEVDPVLESLIAVATENNSEYVDQDDFISDLLLQSIGIDSEKTEVVVPGYNRYEFVVEQLIESPDNDLDSEKEILETAIIESLSL